MQQDLRPMIPRLNSPGIFPNGRIVISMMSGVNLHNLSVKVIDNHVSHVMINSNDIVESEEDNSKLSPWAITTFDDDKYPYLPEKPVDADPLVVRMVLRNFVKLVMGMFSQYY
jgi:hypothetical protein